MTRISVQFLLVASALVSALLCGVSAANPITFSFSNVLSGTGEHLGASATFDTFSGAGCPTALCLKLTLSNTGDPAAVPADALTALFFDLEVTSTAQSHWMAFNTES